VQGKTLESLFPYSRTGSITIEDSINHKELSTKDLVAFIVQSANIFCLAVMEVVGFRFKKEKTLKLVMGIEHLTNAKSDFKVNGQIIDLSPCLDSDVDAWDWTKRYVHLDVTSRTGTAAGRLTQAQFILEVPASLVYPVAGFPVRTLAGNVGNQLSDLTWRINKADLDNILTVAWGLLNGEGEDILGNLPLIPKITNPNTIPYQDASSRSIYHREQWILLIIKIFRESHVNGRKCSLTPSNKGKAFWEVNYHLPFMWRKVAVGQNAGPCRETHTLQYEERRRTSDATTICKPLFCIDLI
jgi:hypothetical protein